MAALVKLSLLLVLACFVLAQGRRKTEKDYRIVNPFVCTQGVSFKEDCNYCSCFGNGVRACTLMACSLGRDECIPGSVFEISGELCTCPECGYKWHSDCFADNYCPR